MMKLKLMLTFLLSAFLVKTNQQVANECIILNREYDKGFLYDDYLYEPYLYTAPRNYVEELPYYFDDVRRAQWILTPAPFSNITYLIKNKLLNKYLYAKENTFGDFFDRRIVDLGNLTKKSFFSYLYQNGFHQPESAWWELRKQPNNWYEIWNVKFNERKLSFFLNNSFSKFPKTIKLILFCLKLFMLHLGFLGNDID